MITLAVNSIDAGRLFQALREEDECAWVLSARPRNDGQLLLSYALDPVPDAAYLDRGPRRLVISSEGFVPAFSRSRHNKSVPVFVHTHPGGDPRPSSLDREVDRLLLDHARHRGVAGYASLIISGSPAHPRFTGRYYASAGGEQTISKVRVAGNDLRVLLNDDYHDGSAAPLFDRHVRAFGHDGQRLLSRLRVGVAGAGGTGSATIEQLARLGVGHLVVIDDDDVEETNLTRIHESTKADVGTSKAELARRRAEGMGTGTSVTAIRGSAASLQGVRELSTCDIVFGCTDDNAGRLVLNRLAYEYLIPVIDSGVVVDVDSNRGGSVRGVVGRVTLAVPGQPCLLCRGQVDATLASEEMMDPAMRLARAGEGYARGAEAPAPAVVAFTTAVSSIAVNEMLGRLFGYMASTSSQLLVRFHDQAIGRGGRPAKPDHMCCDPSRWALGTDQPPLGLVGLS